MPLVPLDIKPYFDDFDEDKGFVHVLFRPGHPVQSRELTTLQSIMKNQIEKFGDHFFKNGSQILDGGINIGTVDVLLVNDFTLLNSINGNTNLVYTSADVERMKGMVVTGRDSGVKGKIIDVIDETSTTATSIRVVVSYLQSGVINSEIETRAGANTMIGDVNYVEGTRVERFLLSEQVEALPEDNVGEIDQTFALVFTRTVQGVMASSREGTYYVDGNFINTDAQTTLLTTTLDYGVGLLNDQAVDATTEALATFKVGFVITTEFIDASQDSTLYDNAAGHTAFGTEGAHRLKASLTLSQRAVDEQRDQNFIELVRVEDNEILRDVSDESQYSALIDIMARRTSDESGDYYLNPFHADIQPKTDETLLDTDGVVVEDNENFVLALGGSKAYVRGYEIEKDGTTHITIPRPRTTTTVVNQPISINIGNQIFIVETNGSTDPYTGSLLALDYSGDANYDTGVVRLQGDLGSGIEDIALARVISVNDTTGVKSLSLMDITPEGNGTTDDLVKVERVLLPGDVSITHLEVLNVDQNSLTITGGSSSLVFGTGYTVQSLVADSTSFLGYTYNGTAGTFTEQTFIEQNGRTKSQTYANYRFDSLAVAQDVANAGANVTDIAGATGFMADDDFIALEVDTNKVIAVLETNDENGYPPHGHKLLFAESAAPFTVGEQIVGKISGTTAFVYRSNSSGISNKTTASLYAERDGGLNSSNYLYSESGTGDDTILEVVGLVGDGFERGEEIYQYSNGLTVQLEDSESFFEETDSSDITSRFVIDTGHRNTFLDVGRLKYKDGAQKATNMISVLFGHYTVETSGAFSDAGTYDSIGNDKALAIESFDPATLEESLVQDLRDFLDFRLINTFDHESFRNNITQANLSENNPFSFENRQFPTTLVLPMDTKNIITDLNVYQGRIDNIVLTKDGDFVNVQGAPSLNPSPPADVNDAMLLNELTLPAYTRYLDDIDVFTEDNRRYTMRDIGDIEDTVTELQEIVTLNALELSALTDYTASTVTGNERLKLGFMADAFSDESKVDLNSADNTTIIDKVDKRLIAAKTFETIPVSEATDTDAFNYVVNNGMVTLSFTETPLITQRKATGVIKINPYDAWTWDGNMVLEPSRDFWRVRKQVNNLVVINNEGQVRRTRSPQLFAKWLRPVSIRSSVTSTSFSGWRNGTRWVDRRSGQVERTLKGAIPHWRVFKSRNNLRRFRTEAFSTRSVTRISKTTTTTDRVVSYKDSGILYNITAIDKMRGKNIIFKVDMMRPNTQVFARFDDTDVTQYCSQYKNNILGGVFEDAGTLTTDSIGRCYGMFALPNDMFSAGKKNLIISASDPDISSAEAIYEASGNHVTETRNITAVRKTRREVRTTISTRKERRNKWKDPIAESFLIEKDCYLSSVDIYPQLVEGTETFKTPDQVVQLLDDFGLVGLDSVIVGNYFNLAVQFGGNISTTQIKGGFNNSIDAQNLYFFNNEAIDVKSFNNDPSQFVSFIADEWTKLESTGHFVSVEIVTCENGYPTTDTIPGSYVVMHPGDIANVADPANPTPNKLYASDDASQRSIAKFDYPIYVKGGMEYAIVIKSPSGRNTVWISEMGQRTVDTDETVSSQPYLGSLFTSQNSSTWTAEQTKDLMFVLNRCVFDTNGRIDTVNEQDEDYRPIGEAADGVSVSVTEGSNVMQITHPNHCMHNNTENNKINIHKVKLLNLTASSANQKGLTDGDITGGTGNGAIFEVSTRDAVYDNNIFITAGGSGYEVGDVLTITNIVNGNDATVEVREVDNSKAITRIASSGATGSTFFGIPLSDVNNITHEIVDFDENGYSIQVNTAATRSGTGGSSLVASQNIQFDSMRVMCNMIQPSGTFLNAVVDTRNYGHSIGNKQTTDTFREDAPTADNRSFSLPINEEFELDQPRLIISNVNASATADATSIQASFELWSSDDKYLSPIFDTQDLEVLASRSLINNLIPAPEITSDIDNTSPYWSSVDPATALSKHVTIPISLTNPSAAIKVLFDYEMTEENKFSVYYKTIETGSDISFEDLSWTYHATEITDETSTNAEVLIGGDTPLPEFSDFKIMIVMHSLSEALTPSITNLKIIALTE